MTISNFYDCLLVLNSKKVFNFVNVNTDSGGKVKI